MKKHKFLPEFKIKQQLLSLSEVIDWGLVLSNIPESWKESRGENVLVAVLDTMAKTDHSDVSPAIIDSYDFTDDLTQFDLNGHGSATAGVIGARANNNGIIGIAPECKIIGIKVLSHDGSGSYDSILDGINKAISLKVDVINMSLGSPSSDKRILAALQKASLQGITVVAANGNDSGPVNYPAKYSLDIQGMMAVAAIDKKGKIAKFSSRGKETTLAAPGVEILVPFLNNSYVKLSGTSFSSPFVAGICALLISKHRKNQGNTPIFTPEDVKKHMLYLCEDAGSPGFDDEYGYGIPNMVKFSEDDPRMNPKITLCQRLKNWLK